jgi:hypothetical protein
MHFFARRIPFRHFLLDRSLVPVLPATLVRLALDGKRIEVERKRMALASVKAPVPGV